MSGTAEWNDARAVMWEGYQLERTSIPLWSHYNNGTNDVPYQVIDIPFHSLGPLSSALSAAGRLLRSAKDGTPVSAITTLKPSGSRALLSVLHDHGFWISGESLTRQCHGLPCRWMGDTRFWKQASGENLHATVNCKCYLVTSKNSIECQRCIANMKKDRQSILPMLVDMATRLWRFVQMKQMFFVMSLTFQYKISIPLFKHFGTKTGMRLIDLAKFVSTTDI